MKSRQWIHNEIDTMESEIARLKKRQSDILAGDVEVQSTSKVIDAYLLQDITNLTLETCLRIRLKTLHEVLDE
jgi:hypothetical protein